MREPRVKDLLDAIIRRASDGKPIADTSVDFASIQQGKPAAAVHPVEAATVEPRPREARRP